MKKAPIKTFGLQRTGTNLVTQLLVRNFHARSMESELEWKHGPIASSDLTIDGEPLRLVVCVRDPFAWLASCWRYFRANYKPDRSVCRFFDPQWSFAEFCRRRHYRWPTPVARWNAMYRRYLDTLARSKNPSIVVRAEDLLGPEAQRATGRRMERELQLRQQRVFHPILNRVTNTGKLLNQRMDEHYYRSRAYILHYSPRLLADVAAELDTDLMSELGYGETRGKVSV